jgi:hypothetical protein
MRLMRGRGGLKKQLLIVNIRETRPRFQPGSTEKCSIVPAGT